MRKGHFPNYDNAEVSWKTLKQLIPYLLEFRVRIILALLCLVGAKIASVSIPFVMKYIVDHLDQHSAEENTITVLVSLLVVFGLVRFGNVIFGEIRDILFGRVTERAMRRIGLSVFKHLHALDLDFHLNRRTGGLSRDIERGTAGVSFLLRFMVFNIVPTLLEILFIVSALLLNYDAWFAFIVFISFIAYVAWTIKATEWRTKYIRAANDADSQSSTQAIDSLLNYETVKYFNNEDFESRRYDKDLATWEKARAKNRSTLFILNSGQALVTSLSITAMLALTSYHIVNGEMSIGDFTLMFGLTIQVFMPLNFFGFVYREMKGSMINIENMFSLLRQKPKVKDERNAAELVVTAGKIEFDRVSFAYDNTRPILKDISFSVPAGQKVAFVGSSGGGKSTLMKLLYRFYDPSEGKILVDDQEISKVTQDSLRKAIGIVPQDTTLFNSTIWENVQYGNISASKEDVKTAIRHSHLDQFINDLPDGYQTKVGERGLKLSGGEKQRIAIARAILKKPPILLFDEATSSLDSKSEQYILNAINEIAKDHTSVVIAHRLSTVVDADVIYVLNQGKIVEQGSHHALLQANGHYAHLWKIQQTEKSQSTE